MVVTTGGPRRSQCIWTLEAQHPEKCQPAVLPPPRGHPCRSLSAERWTEEENLTGLWCPWGETHGPFPLDTALPEAQLSHCSPREAGRTCRSLRGATVQMRGPGAQPPCLAPQSTMGICLKSISSGLCQTPRPSPLRLVKAEPCPSTPRRPKLCPHPCPGCCP